MTSPRVTRAIIVAAGRGRRLGPETDAVPKCMVEVAGRPILHWQLGALAAAGVDDVVIVRGYRGARIDAAEHRVRFVENSDWAENNILASLLCAADEMKEGFFFSYADIVYAPAVARKLTGMDDATHVALVIDRRWQDAYVGRDQHPVGEAELASVHDGAAGPTVAQVGKRAVAPEAAAGEFIGLARFSATGAAALRSLWDERLAEGGLDQPFGRAPRLRQAYLTDALNALAARGTRLLPVFIDGAWREIDTRQDLERAEQAASSWR